ncbi:hypothetical protein PIB30_089013 [Stylosanthes scabra]|uniref:Putative plant transposon protein domain-containing protein n=1 Tax=Stylosanthes scabra TaxID=79078 RepID=A0ABU6SV93_9FABA|nr:hypothetical protein [Stylosanthes scabra]
MASSSSYINDDHCFRSQFHQDLFQQYIHKKGVTPEKHFELREGQYPETLEQIGMRGWRRLSKPRTKISKVLIQEFYANAVRTEPEIASVEDYPNMSYVRGVPVDFSAAKIREVLKIHFLTPRAKTDFKTRQMEYQRLDEVIRDICMPGARWKMSTSQPDQPIQLNRHDLTPLARGWAEFIIHSIIPTGNKSEITAARVVLIQSIIKGHDVRVEELIANNIPSTIFRLCKEAGVSMAEFRGTEFIPVTRLITAKVMTTTRARNINNQPQDQHMEEDGEQWQHNDNDLENEFINPEEHDQPEVDFEDTYQEQQQGFQQQGFQQFQDQKLKLYLEELKALKTKQNGMHTQQNNFNRQIKKEQGDLAKEIEEIKKFQVNQTLMGFHPGPIDKMEERIHETRNEIIEMRGQIKEWIRNASAREAYCCWAHQQANPNLVPIPACEIAKFVHENATKKMNIFHGALKNFEQGGPSNHAKPPLNPIDIPMEEADKES